MAAARPGSRRSTSTLAPMRLRAFFLVAVLLSACATDPEYVVGGDGNLRSMSAAQQAIAAKLAATTAALDPPLDSPVEILRLPLPPYPEEIRRANIEGDVTLRFMVERDGTVSDAAVLGSPSPMLAEVSLHTVRQWRFKPMKRNGEAIRVPVEQTFSFKLK